MVQVYSLVDDPSVEELQKVSASDSPFGFSPSPELIGTSAWWKAISDGRIPLIKLQGHISSVGWVSSGDWPVFTIQTDLGASESFTREGNVTLYVVGLRVWLEYVEVPFKTESMGLQSDKVVTAIWVEISESRTDGIPPGPERAMEREAKDKTVGF